MLLITKFSLHNYPLTAYYVAYSYQCQYLYCNILKKITTGPMDLFFILLDKINLIIGNNKVDFLWNRTLVVFEDKLSSTTVDFIRSEGELKNWTLYGF